MSEVTTASAWREKRKVELTLPEYGDVVSIRPMDADYFFKAGRIPDFLSATVQEMIMGKQWAIDMPSDLTPEKTKDWLQWLDELVTFALVSPKVVGTPQSDDEITIDEIGYRDKLFIYSFFGRSAAVLRNFREQQIKPVATVDASQNNGANTEQGAGDQAVGQPTAGHA